MSNLLSTVMGEGDHLSRMTLGDSIIYISTRHYETLRPEPTLGWSPSIGDRISHLEACSDKQNKEKIVPAAIPKGPDNLYKNKGVRDNDGILTDVNIYHHAAWKDARGMIIEDVQLEVISAFSFPIFTVQLWTLPQQPFSRNPTPEDTDKQSHIRNVVIRSLEDKSSARAKLHSGIIKRSKDAFEDKRAIYSRYRFKQNHLRFLGTFSDVRDQPGWILPTAAKILVNVTQTGDTDAWSGQVEGSEERGMFLYSAVEPA